MSLMDACQLVPFAGHGLIFTLVIIGGKKVLYAKSALFAEVYRQIYGQEFSLTVLHERSCKT